MEHEGGILHTINLEDRLKVTLTEINEEIDRWYYLLGLKYESYIRKRE